MLSDPEFWVLVAFLIFVGIVWYVGGFTAFTSGLDARGKRIQAELDEATRFRQEAEGVLADYKRRRTEAEREAEAMVSAARDEAERIAHEAQARLSDLVTRRTAAAEARIAQAQQQAEQQVRAAAADAAVQVSEMVLHEQLRGEAGQDLISRSLGDVRKTLHS